MRNLFDDALFVVAVLLSFSLLCVGVIVIEQLINAL